MDRPASNNSLRAVLREKAFWHPRDCVPDCHRLPDEDHLNLCARKGGIDERAIQDPRLPNQVHPFAIKYPLKIASFHVAPPEPSMVMHCAHLAPLSVN
jgi:hypothetical protein